MIGSRRAVRTWPPGRSRRPPSGPTSGPSFQLTPEHPYRRNRARDGDQAPGTPPSGERALQRRRTLGRGEPHAASRAVSPSPGRATFCNQPTPSSAQCKVRVQWLTHHWNPDGLQVAFSPPPPPPATSGPVAYRARIRQGPPFGLVINALKQASEIPSGTSGQETHRHPKVITGIPDFEPGFPTLGPSRYRPGCLNACSNRDRHRRRRSGKPRTIRPRTQEPTGCRIGVGADGGDDDAGGLGEGVQGGRVRGIGGEQGRSGRWGWSAARRSRTARSLAGSRPARARRQWSGAWAARWSAVSSPVGPVAPNRTMS